MLKLPRDTVEIWNTITATFKLHGGLLCYNFMEVKREDNEAEVEQSLNMVCSRTDSSTMNQIGDRLEVIIGFLKESGYFTEKWTQTLQKRMAVGLGIPSPIENGLALDHTHGLPYIPGSVLKGIAQDYALLFEFGAGSGQTLRSAKRDPLFIKIFGEQSPEEDEDITDFQARKGEVVFFDAFVSAFTGPSPFDIDIINPHHQAYFEKRERKPPADYLRPNPIKFLTVKKGVEFTFCVAAREENLFKKAKSWVSLALQFIGAGGKTHVGYGIFGQPPRLKS